MTTVAEGDDAAVDPVERPEPRRGRVPSRAATAVAVTAGYLVVSLICWQHLLAAGIGSQYLSLPLGDVGQGVWFIGWLPFALGHGLNPLTSAYMFAPKGFNLLANTNYFLEAFVLSPITAATNPLVSFNLACIAAPVVSAGSLYYVLRRYDLAVPAAFVGGLAYGFGPAILQADRVGHFNLAWMFFPPLLVLLLDRIFFRQDGSPVTEGALLGLLVVAQFFSSTEILLDCVVVALPVLVVVALARPGEVAGKVRYAAIAGGTALAIAGALLAYPLAVYFGGAEHVRFVNAHVTPGTAVISPVWPAEPVGKGFLEALAGTPWTHRFDPGFVGPVLLLLALGALRFARQHRVIWVLWGAALWSFLLSWGAETGVGGARFGWHAPAYYLASWLPLLRNVGWIRVSVLTDLLVAVLATITLDRLVRQAARRHAAAGVAVAGAAGLLACVPIVLASNVPFADFVPVDTPSVLSQLPLSASGSPLVAAVSPVGGVFNGQPIAWQAMAGYRFKSIFGYAWRPVRGSATGVGVVTSPPTVLLYVSVYAPVTSPHIVVSAAQRRQVRRSFANNHVELAVVVDGVRGARSLTRVYSQILGPGRHIADGTVWLLTKSGGPAPASAWNDLSR